MSPQSKSGHSNKFMIGLAASDWGCVVLLVVTLFDFYYIHHIYHIYHIHIFIRRIGLSV